MNSEDKKIYEKYANGRAEKSPCAKNCIKAFLIGGAICCAAQGLKALYQLFFSEKDAGSMVSVTLIFITALLTGIGVFDNIAKHAGAGTLVPITGFANSVVSPAIEFKAEGWVTGVGAKIFTIAGPVIAFGTLASFVWGVVYWLVGKVG